MDIANDRRVLVTGGGSGFGLATAKALADRGARVVIADNNAEKLKQAAADDGRLTPVPFDVTDAAAVTMGVAAAREAVGGLDTLVICAGVIHVKPLSDVTEAEWDFTLNVNLKGAFLVSQAAAPALAESGRGRVVAIASDASKRGYPWLQAYCASKFGLMGLCESLAVELAPAKVTVNCVCPATCPTTGMGQELLALKARTTGKSEEEVLAATAASFPIGRYVLESDVVNAALYFISETAGFITGVSLDVDGGEHLGYTPGMSEAGK